MLELNHDQNVFSISFRAIDYLNGNNQQYYYKLEGGNDQWINNGSSNTVSFANISPGTYTLLVKYYNCATNRESRTATLQIRIRPPWYFSNGAKSLYFIFILSCIGLFIHYLMKRSQRHHDAIMQQLEQQHKEEVYESKLNFFTNIAHEFCTPLSLIYAPVNRILRIKHLDQPTLRYAGLIKTMPNA